ncbi:ABC transporter substrate-binding protein [Microcoleus sp. Pol11C2]|uniref:nSTAND1 domain-containing NTPase n=1 Tax=Microcoleus sp. Pol11C2 TaxID=3055389 RepID=UPI002FD00CED
MSTSKHEFNRNFAIIIGINEYQSHNNDIRPLETARPDAEEFARILGEEYKHERYEIQLLLDEDGTLKRLNQLMENFKQKQIIVGKEKLDITENDRLIFYFAGHGKALEALDSQDGPVGYLIPQDATNDEHTWLPMEDLHDALIELPCRHLLVILDSCFAGAFRWSCLKREWELEVKVYKERYDHYISDPAWQVITSAADDQKAADSFGKRGQTAKGNHSPFAQALFDALCGTNNQKDDNRNNKTVAHWDDGIITATDLYSFLRKQVEPRTEEKFKRQTPGLCELRKHRNGEFIFLLPDFNRNKLEDAPELNPENNPYRGLESYNEEDSDLFFGREEQIKKLYHQFIFSESALTVVLGASGTGKSSLVKAGLIPYLKKTSFAELKKWKQKLEQNLTQNKEANELEDQKRKKEEIDDLKQQENQLTTWQNKLESLIQQLGNVKSTDELKLFKQDLLEEFTKQNILGELKLLNDSERSFEQQLANLNKQLETHLQYLNHPWQFLGPIRFGNYPFQTLNNALEQCLGVPSFMPDPNQVKEDIFDNFSKFIKLFKGKPHQTHKLEREVKKLSKNLESWIEKYPESKLLIVIDQSEELITLCRDEQEREQFLIWLEKTINSYSKQLRIVLTLRSDFEPQFQDAVLKNYWANARFVVPAMKRAELRQAIEEPAAQKVMYFDPHLVDELLDEVEQMPGALPLLSFTLSELYFKYLDAVKDGKRNNRALTKDDYKDLGGVVRSLTKSANRKYEELVKRDKAYEQTIRRVMLRMVAVGGGELARRRVLESELKYPGLEENERRKTVVQEFVDARLLVTDTNKDNKKYIEPAHDALIMGWGKIKNWLDERQEMSEKRSISLPFGKKSDNPLKINLVLQRELTNAANNWLSKKVSDGYIMGYIKAIGFLWYDDPRLPQLKQIKQSEDNWFNITEAKFVNSSIRQKRINLGVITAVGISIFLAVLWQLQLSLLREKAARTQNLLQAETPVEGLMLAIQATGESQFRLRHVITPVKYSLSNAVANSREQLRIESNQGEVLSVAFSPDGQRIVSGGQNGTIALWSIIGKVHLLFESTSTGNSINFVDFSSDGKKIVSSSNDGLVRLWDLNGNEIKKFSANNNSKVISVSFNHKSNSIAISYEDGRIALGNFETGNNKFLTTLPSESGTKPSNLVALSPNGLRVAAIRDGKLLLWKSQGGKPSEHDLNPPNIIEGDVFNRTSSICSIAFLDDKNILIGRGTCLGLEGSGSIINFNVEKWELRENSELYLSSEAFEGHTLPVTSIASDSDGTIASGSEDNTIRLWGSDKDIPPVLLGHTGKVNAVAFNPKAQQLVSASSDGTIRLWDVSDSFNVSNIQYPELTYEGKKEEFQAQDYVKSLAFSPDGNFFAIGRQATVMLFDSQGRLVKPPFKRKRAEQNGIEFVNAVAFSPDGKTIISGSDDKTLRLWDLKGNPPKVFQGHTDKVTSVAFSPDGKTIISGSDDKTLSLWDLKGNPPKVFQGHTDKVTSVAFSPDGKTIISGSDDKTLRLWDLEGKPKGKPFEGHTDKVTSVALSPDGKTIISGSDDKTLRLWDLKGKPTGFRIINAHSRSVKSVAFSPNGKTIVSASADQTVKFWNLDGSLASIPFQNSTEATYPQHIPIAFNPNSNTLLTSIQGVKEAGSYLRLLKPLIDWQDWLKVACNRLQYHPVLQNPKDDEEKGAKNTCQNYVWNKQTAQDTQISIPDKQPEVEPITYNARNGQNTQISMGDKILVPTLTNPNKEAGVKAIASGDLEQAITSLTAYLDPKNNPNDPEARIYLNNARIGNQRSYTIAVSAPISNDVNGSLEILRGVAQAQNDFNNWAKTQQGIIPIRVLIADDLNDPKVAQEIAKKLADNPDVLGVVGHFSSGVTREAATVYNKEGLVAISPVSTSVNLSNVLGKDKYVFRTVPSDQVAAEKLADYTLKSFKKQKAVLFYNSQTEYSCSLASEFTTAFSGKRGEQLNRHCSKYETSPAISQAQGQGQILKEVDLSAPDFDVAKSLQRLDKNTVLVLLADTSKLNHTFEVLKANKGQLPILGGDALYGPTILEKAGKQAIGMVVAIPWHIENNRESRFSTASKNLWGDRDVNWRTVMSYDAAKALMAAIKQNPNRKEIAKVLQSNTFPAQAAIEPVQFLPSGDRDGNIIELVKIQPGSNSGYGYDFVTVENNTNSNQVTKPKTSK